MKDRTVSPPYTPELIKDIIQWDIPNWQKALHFWEKHTDFASGMQALGIGEREGGLSLWLALKGVQVTCSDFNPFPEATRILHQKYAVQHLLKYQKEDATQLSMPDNSFDIVIIKSVLGALSTKERQQKAINEFYRVLKPGGVLLLAENMEATAFHTAVRKHFAPWAVYWRYLSFKNDMDLFDRFSTRQTAGFGFWGFMGKGRLERITHEADKITGPLIPKKWRYIMAGVFKK